MPAGPSRRWPTKEPAAIRDYTWDVQKDLTDPCTGTVDPLVTLTLTIKPSGTGELSATRLSLDANGFCITVRLSGGVAGRPYLVNIEGTTESGLQHQWPIGIEVDQSLATWPPPVVPNPGYGPPLTWSLAPNEFGLVGADGAQLLGHDAHELIWVNDILHHGITGADGPQLLGADGADLAFA
jgi:hypothetical protein